MMTSGGMKAYGQFSSTVTQRPITLNAVKVVLDTHQDTSGDELTADYIRGGIIVNKSGTYLMIVGSQMGRLAGSEPRWIDFWIRVNDKDLANSNVRAVLKDPQSKDVLVTQVVAHLNKGDMINIMMTVEVADEGLGIEAIQPKSEPLVPSMILTILQL